MTDQRARKRPTTKMLRANAKRMKKLAEVPAPADGVPIGDSPEKLDTNRETITLPVKQADGTESKQEYTVSPLRALLGDRGRTIRSNEHYPTAKTRQGVMYAAGLGLSQKAIAKVVGISLDTLRAHYQDELECSRDVMMNDIQTNLYNIARDAKHKSTVQAGIFMLSKLGGSDYNERRALEEREADLRNLEVNQQTRTIDPTLLSPAQRDALRDIVTSAIRLTQESGPVQLEGNYKDVSDDV